MQDEDNELEEDNSKLDKQRNDNRYNQQAPMQEGPNKMRNPMIRDGMPPPSIYPPYSREGPHGEMHDTRQFPPGHPGQIAREHMRGAPYMRGPPENMRGMPYPPPNHMRGPTESMRGMPYPPPGHIRGLPPPDHMRGLPYMPERMRGDQSDKRGGYPPEHAQRGGMRIRGGRGGGEMGYGRGGYGNLNEDPYYQAGRQHQDENYEDYDMANMDYSNSHSNMSPNQRQRGPPGGGRGGYYGRQNPSDEMYEDQYDYDEEYSPRGYEQGPPGDYKKARKMPPQPDYNRRPHDGYGQQGPPRNIQKGMASNSRGMSGQQYDPYGGQQFQGRYGPPPQNYQRNWNDSLDREQDAQQGPKKMKKKQRAVEEDPVDCFYEAPKGDKEEHEPEKKRSRQIIFIKKN